MAVGYAKRRTVRLYDGPTGSAFKMVLIFGDAVDRSGVVENGREQRVEVDRQPAEGHVCQEGQGRLTPARDWLRVRRRSRRPR